MMSKINKNENEFFLIRNWVFALFKFIANPLNRPLKRGGFLVFIVGLCVLVPQLYLMFRDNYYGSEWGYVKGFFYNWWRSLFYESRENTVIQIGTFLTFIGISFSYGYEYTTGKLFKWIREG